jgi:hypothetical protein
MGHDWKDQLTGLDCAAEAIPDAFDGGLTATDIRLLVGKRLTVHGTAGREILRLAERVKLLEAGIDINVHRDLRRAEESAVKLAERVRELEGAQRWYIDQHENDGARIATLEAENAAVRWQPIATAPKDGRWVLLGWFLEHGGGGHPDVAFWRSDIDRWHGGGRDLKAEGYFSPTHWMPLPAHPTASPASPEPEPEPESVPG